MLENKILKRAVLYGFLMPLALVLDAVEVVIVKPALAVGRYLDQKFTDLSEWAND